MMPVSKGRPSGISLGRALTISPGIVNEDLRAIVSFVDRVHGDGTLPAIDLGLVKNVVDRRSDRLIDGAFIYDLDEHGGVHPISIRVRHDAPHRALVVLHEIGHFLDGCGLPGTGFASMSSPSLGDWRQAASRSRAGRDLDQIAREANTAVALRAVTLLQPEELWARSYAQFVAIRSQSAVLQASLVAFRRRLPGDVYLPRQWEDDDFADIETAIDVAFRRLGWIVK